MTAHIIFSGTHFNVAAIDKFVVPVWMALQGLEHNAIVVIYIWKQQTEGQLESWLLWQTVNMIRGMMGVTPPLTVGDVGKPVELLEVSTEPYGLGIAVSTLQCLHTYVHFHTGFFGGGGGEVGFFFVGGRGRSGRHENFLHGHTQGTQSGRWKSQCPPPLYEALLLLEPL